MGRFVSLLIVQDGADRKVVSVDDLAAVPGDLVEYVVPQEEPEDPEVGFRWDTPEKTALGVVLKKMDCDRFGNEWSFVAEIDKIHRGKAVYRCVWDREQGENT